MSTIFKKNRSNVSVDFAACLVFTFAVDFAAVVAADGVHAARGFRAF